MAQGGCEDHGFTLEQLHLSSVKVPYHYYNMLFGNDLEGDWANLLVCHIQSSQ